MSASQYYALEIKVSGLTEAARLQLRGRTARIYLHPTFPSAIRFETFDDGGIIELALVAYGAFTLGVQLWDNRLFELDLAGLPDAPSGFREN